MPKGKNKKDEYINLKGQKITGNDTEIDFYKKCEKAVAMGFIDDFKYQVEFELLPAVIDNDGEMTKNTVHLVDFIIKKCDDFYFVDTKGSGGMKSHDNVSKLKRLMLMNKYPGHKYYMISQLPGYLGKHWVDSTSGNDLRTKAVDTYHKLYPWSKTRSKDAYIMDVNELHEYYEIFNVDHLFYSTRGNIKKNRKEKPNPQRSLII